jgi:predicted transcriptional regulator of viral defense system
MGLRAWREISPNARALLVEVLAAYHPSAAPVVELPVRRAAELLRVSKSAAGRAIAELENAGWIAPLERGKLGKRAPSRYRLTMMAHPETGEPASHDYRAF